MQLFPKMECDLTSGDHVLPQRFKQPIGILLLQLIVASLCTAAIGQSNPPDRGFGKVSPEYISWYHSRVKTPIYLVDNQGRNAARILIYTWAPPGAPVTQHVIRGDDQFDKDVKLKIIVDNLTTNCKVDVNCLAFLFREDGQPSSAGLDAPPGADPDTSVAAGQSYVHIFTFTEVKTYVNRGTPVLHEVKPEVVLQCLGSHGDESSNSQSSPIRSGTVRTQSSVKNNSGQTHKAMEALQVVSQLLTEPSAFKLNGNDATDYVDDIKISGCKLSFFWHEKELTRGINNGEAKEILDFTKRVTLDPAQRIDANYGNNPGPRGAADGTVYILTVQQVEQDYNSSFGYNSNTKDNRDRLLDALKQSVIACAGPAPYITER